MSPTFGVAAAQPLVTVRDMRIELPLPAWHESTQRADDDAHTLTVEAPRATEWVAWQWPVDPSHTLRTEVRATPPVVLTITL